MSTFTIDPDNNITALIGHRRLILSGLKKESQTAKNRLQSESQVSLSQQPATIALGPVIASIALRYNRPKFGLAVSLAWPLILSGL